jgi:dynein heavy chain, axonemal
MRHLFSSSSPFPIPETVYDYYLDENFTFQPWTNLVNALNIPKGESTVNLLIPTSVTAAYTHIFSILNSANKSILLIGNSGAGKSAIISMHLSNLLRKQEIELVTANFSARTTSLKAQQYIEAKLEKKSVGVYSGRSQKKLFIFFDDVNMPSKDQFGTQPTIELLRQLQDKQGFYDRNKLLFKTISNYFMICVASNPAVKEVTPRFIRHFNVLYLSDPSRATLSYIFTTVLSHHFEKTFAETVRKSIPVIISSTIDLFQRVTVKLKPTPSKFHYNFNQRDIGKVIQGMTLSTNVTVPSLEKVTKLWLNETCRVFYDRLATPQDRNWFIKSANSVAMKYYKVSFLTDDWLETHPLMFSNLSSIDTDTPLYEEVGDRKKLKKFIEDRLEDFNSKNRQKMNLEIFEEAMEHIVRICKGIYQYRSNMMLIGVGGSGKQSLAALSSFLLSYEQCSLNLTKNYNIEDFHNDLKKMMEIAAVVHQPVTFVFTDSLMVYDAFLEDINALINSGEISDLFNEEEIENILNQLRPELVDKLGILDTKESLYSEFIARVRNNLHVIISTSPIGETLRNRCRMFPAFVNCCTIDWFESWPEEALVSVALSKFDKLSSSYKSLSIIASKIHLSSQNTSNLYFDQLKRISYVTPKLFFDFIELFTLYFNQKNSELLGKKKKLSNGLEKLHETRKLIAELQIKLQEMIPDLEIQKKKAEVYYQEVQKETSAAIELQLVVEKETEFIEMQAQECKLRAEDAEKDLAETMPVLESAIKAVQALEKNKKDIIEFKKYLKPPEAVKTVMEAVCILLNERSDWTNAVSVLGQMDFLQRLINYNRESVTNSIFKKLRGIVSRPEFQPEIVAQSSEAARSLCIWSIAMYKFTEAFQLVKPKREKVFSMQVKLKSDMEKLENKQEELQQVEKKVKVLKDECAITESKVLGLEKDIKITIERVKRAELLLELLAEEGIKWNETLEVLENSLKYVEGETIANAGYACYLGVYCDEYRTSLKSSWSSTIKALNHQFTRKLLFYHLNGQANQDPRLANMRASKRHIFNRKQYYINELSKMANANRPTRASPKVVKKH